MDFDGVIERHNHYLIFETKEPGKEIPQAQQWTLERLREAKSFCIMKVWGKVTPESFEAQFGIVRGIVYKPIIGEGINAARDFVKRWFCMANKKLDK